MKKKEKLPPFYWNHRIVKYKDGSLGIHEAYYEPPKKGPTLITENAVGVHGESVKELKETLERMLRALKKKPLSYKKYLKHHWKK